MNRWKASGTHFCLSILVIGGIAATAFSLWYPHGLYRVAGLDRLLLVMLGIDLTAGPLLTLILYRPGKWGLKFDLTAIAVAQIAFLSYGLHTLWLARPVFLVGTPETMTLVFASEISDADLVKASRPEWRHLSWTGPQLVGTKMPSDPEKHRQIIEEFMAGGTGIERSPKYYMDYDTIVPELLRNARPVQGTAIIRDADVRKAGKPREQLRWTPIVSRRGEGLILLDARSGRPLQTLPAPGLAKP